MGMTTSCYEKDPWKSTSEPVSATDSNGSGRINVDQPTTF